MAQSASRVRFWVIGGFRCLTSLLRHHFQWYDVPNALFLLSFRSLVMNKFGLMWRLPTSCGLERGFCETLWRRGGWWEGEGFCHSSPSKTDDMTLLLPSPSHPSKRLSLPQAQPMANYVGSLFFSLSLSSSILLRFEEGLLRVCCSRPFLCVDLPSRSFRCVVKRVGFGIMILARWCLVFSNTGVATGFSSRVLQPEPQKCETRRAASASCAVFYIPNMARAERLSVFYRARGEGGSTFSPNFLGLGHCAEATV